MATTQTKWVMGRLQEKFPELEVELKIIKTTGDRDQKTSLDKFSGMGVFVKELRSALLNKDIDCAVHSLKDVPEDQPAGLSLVSYPEREDASDVFISKGVPFRNMPSGAAIGTGSPRRIMQLQQLRGDLKYVPIRGNLDTRIKKVMDGKIDGIVAAAAGLKRLQRKGEITEHFSFDTMIPAIGQGALALECRIKDSRVKKMLRAVNHGFTEAAVLLEREFMAQVGGGCKVPMACHVYLSGDGFRMMAVMGDNKQKKIARVEKWAGLDEVEQLLDDVTWSILEDCREHNIPIPKDLPDHNLIGG